MTKITYFESEGRKENWPQVLRLVKGVFQNRAEVRSYKVIVFTAIGEGPLAAYNLLQEWDAKIIAVTAPPDFIVTRGDKKLSPRIPAKAKAFFDGVGIPVIAARLPFQAIDGATAHNEQMNLITGVLSLFGGSFAQGVQAVLQACDHGLVEIGEKVFAVTGDSAAIITASNTGKFLTRDQGLSINEIICKARNLTIARGLPAVATEHSGSLFEDDKPRLKAAIPKKQQLIEGQEVTHIAEEKQEAQK
jgi:hypothetical protein